MNVYAGPIFPKPQPVNTRCGQCGYEFDDCAKDGQCFKCGRGDEFRRGCPVCSRTNLIDLRKR